MHSLWKAFTEKRELKVLQNFLLSVTILLFKFPRLSLLFLHKILTQRFLCLLGVIHIWRPLCGWGERGGGIKENCICALNRHPDESKINIKYYIIDKKSSYWCWCQAVKPYFNDTIALFVGKIEFEIPSFVLSLKYLFRSFDLFIMVFLKCLVTKLELLARIKFCFLEHACQVLTERFL